MKITFIQLERSLTTDFVVLGRFMFLLTSEVVLSLTRVHAHK